MREIYLPPFEAAVKRAGAWAVMTSYNRLNGTFASEHRWLIEEVLRGEWGFDGLVMSDWFGSHSTEPTVNAGLDLEMPGPTRDRGAKLVAAVEAGRGRPRAVRARARRVLRLIERVGGFADPSMPEERAVDDPRAPRAHPPARRGGRGAAEERRHPAARQGGGRRGRARSARTPPRRG